MHDTETPELPLYRWRFGDAEFDEAQFELRVGGEPVGVERKPLEVLAMLLRHAGEVVTKDELFDGVWAGRATVDHVLATAVGKLRRALGDGSAPGIVTVPRVGYRLTVPVQRVAVGRAHQSRLQLVAGAEVPARPHFRLERPLGPAAGSEIWLARHAKTGELRVYKFSGDGAQLSGLKREATLSRLLRESLGARDDFVRVIDWNFAEAPFFLECEFGGQSLAEWAAADAAPLASLARADRLALFLRVCDAVAAAHSVGVLHKDLKPANILIAERGGGWQVRLTDFGSSRLLDPERLAQFGITGLGLTMTRDDSTTGTPLYLAPELIAGHAPTVQSDVYALGVVLFQTLVDDFRRPMAPGWEHGIDDELLREDIARATDGNPDRRLASVAELAARLRGLDARHRERHRVAEIEQRERRASDALARTRARRPWVMATIGVLSAGLLASLWLYAEGQRTRLHAEREAARAVAINAFWNEEIVGSGNPYLRDGGPAMSIRSVLERAAVSLQDTFVRHPDTAASIHETLGAAFAGLSDHERAIEEYRAAHRRYAEAFGDGSPVAQRAWLRQAEAHALASEFEAALGILDRFDTHDASPHGYPADVAAALSTAWASYHYGRQEWPEAVAYYERLLALLPQLDLPPSREIRLRIRVADAYQRVARFEDGERLLREVLDGAFDLTRIPAAQRATLELQLGSVLLEQDRYAEAEPLLLESHHALHALLGADHETTLNATNLLSNLYLWTDRPADAARYAAATYHSATASLGPDHHKTLMLGANLGLILLYSGEIEEGVAQLSGSREQLAAHVGERTPYVQMLDYYLMEALVDQDRLDEARAVWVRLDPALLDSAQAGLRAPLRLRAIDALIEWKAGSGRVSDGQLHEWLVELEACDCQLRRMLETALAAS